MLAISNRQLNSTFERIVRDKNGVLVRVRFAIVGDNGNFQAQIISAETIVDSAAADTSRSTQTQSKPFFLPVFKNAPNIHREVKKTIEAFISPYQALDFLMSQPTRAPSYR